jgi:glycosyltransferase involved in cell wall biosynthesis
LTEDSSTPQRTRGSKTYNVLMIAPTSFFADYGCHVRIREEALVLRQMGNRVTICTYRNGRDVAGLDIRRTMPIPWRTDYEVGSSRHKVAFDALLVWKALLVASRVRPNIIHGHLHEGALIGYVVSKLFGVPLVFDFQGSMTGEMVDHHFLNPKGMFYRPARWLEEVIVQLPAAIITSSQHAAQLLEKDFHCPPDKINAIPDCVNADFFAPSQSQQSRHEMRSSLGISPERQVVVYLGLLAEWQGTDLLLQAAAELVARRPNVQFLIMGFPAVDVYREHAHQLGLNNHVTFTGRIPYEQAPSFLSLGDVAVAPKISATEGSGKLLNYMAMGLPIVSFDVPVSREYLDGLGMYAQPGDVSSLAGALETALADSARSQALGQRLRQRVIERYSWAAASQSIIDTYDRVSRR